MRYARTSWIWSLFLVFVGGLPAADGAAPQPKPKPKPGAGRAGLLEIPKVGKDEVICFALYTVNDSILKLTAQLYPLEEEDPRTVRLEVKQDGWWKEVATTEVVNPGWTAPFRVEPWDMTREVPYRVRHGETAVYEGIIRRNPIDKDEFVVAAFTGNSIYPGHGGNIPKADIVANLERIKPDLLFFSGDQHLGTIIHHGIDDWDDAMYSFCVPSIANLYLRWWAPLAPGKNRPPSMPEYTGQFLDGFANKITVWAVANPSPEENHDKLTTRAAGPT